ncbi:SagB family peptide dehydrogenase [Pyxidicoccus sp. MSG2]|uniref:SagB family peptide dehydrogenase n=1 Tax=Pyxidicoccus sp. MSG2 TaxID=2996790 RepID=UPI002270CBE6|nr:SagB family peptide dehydrogenase [Pyxidicoccus sp. MSG2]MCY1014467.1 SagB family peptide dehydrogenase [Pyxidicoccus sp. MSG2]
MSFSQGTTLEEVPDGARAVRGSTGVALGCPAPAVLAALQRLALAGASEEELATEVLSTEGEFALAAFYVCLERLMAAGLIRHTLCLGDISLVTVEPLTSGYRFAARLLEPGGRFLLSRFSASRRDGERLVVESPAAPARAVIHDRRVSALLMDLSAPSSLRELAALPTALPEPVLGSLLGLLLETGLLCEVDAAGAVVEPPTLTHWEPHDLLFHARSRRCLNHGPYGPTYRFGCLMPLPPAVTPRSPEEGLALYRPDIEALKRADIPFTRVLEERRSRQPYAEAPLQALHLGELLYRAARVRRRFAGEMTELTNRPYPGGGALYELELYLAVARCDGIEPGLHHYDPEHHRLHRMCAHSPEVAQLLAEAGFSAGTDDVQVLVILAARFQRVMWKYEAMAYALILKDAGVLLQTLCLVAEAMGLAACPIGGGDAELFARAAGTSPWIEGSVGELILWSRPNASP